MQRLWLNKFPLQRRRLGTKNNIVLQNTKLNMTIVVRIWCRLLWDWVRLTTQTGRIQFLLVGEDNNLTRRLLHLRSSLTARKWLGHLGRCPHCKICALRGGDVRGMSIAMLWVLLPMGGTCVFVGSLRFLDVVPCSTGAMANVVLEIRLASNSRGGGNVDGGCEC